MDNLTKLSDDELIALYREGSSTAFNTLVLRYDAPLHTYIRMSVNDGALADDIFQDTFMKVILTLREGKYTGQGKFKAWVTQVARNLIIDHFRRVKVKNVISEWDESFREELSERLPSEERNAEEELIRQSEHRALHDWIAKLPQAQREVLQLRYLEDMSFKEIVMQTGVSINTALGRMRYALINLRKEATTTYR